MGGNKCDQIWHKNFKREIMESNFKILNVLERLEWKIQSKINGAFSSMSQELNTSVGKILKWSMSQSEIVIESIKEDMSEVKSFLGDVSEVKDLLSELSEEVMVSKKCFNQ